MKTIHKLFVCLLIVCMMIPLMASCNDRGTPHQPSVNTPAPDQPQGGTTPPAGDSTVTTPPDPDADIEKPPVVDLGGYTYRAYVRMHAGDTLEEQLSYGNNRYHCIDFWVADSKRDEDAISFAVYSRNSRIEQDFNCKIRQVDSNGSQLEHLTHAYSNGDTYELAIISAKPAAQAATKNLLRNLNEMTYVDLSHPSFDQNSINELAVADKLYFLSGDMNVSTLEIAGLSIVNMKFYADLLDNILEAFDNDPAYTDIYTLVRNKKWTMDTMMKLATMANVDKDTADGSALDAINKGDTVGYHQYFNSTLWYFYASGGRITAKNDEGIPEFCIGNESNQNLANYIFDHFNRVTRVTWIPHANSATLNQNFLTGQVLFMDCALFEIRTEIYNNIDFEYGILPNPVLEEGDDYHSVSFFNNWAHLWAVPSMVENVEYAERMLHIMAVYSSLHESTMHAYYDRTVYLNAAPNNGSRAVMDIIRTSLVYDIALLYNWGGLEDMLNRLATDSTNPYASSINSIRYIQPKVDETVNKLKNPSLDS